MIDVATRRVPLWSVCSQVLQQHDVACELLARCDEEILQPKILCGQVFLKFFLQQWPPFGELHLVHDIIHILEVAHQCPQGTGDHGSRDSSKKFEGLEAIKTGLGEVGVISEHHSRLSVEMACWG